MKLYGFPMSPNSRRARFGLEELGIAHEYVVVDLMAGAHRMPEYLARNPAGRVPFLEDGDFHLSESNAILQYAASLQPKRALEGAGIRGRAEVLRWMFFGTAHVAPSVGHIFAHTLRLPEDKRIPQLVELARAELDRSMKVLELQLSKTSWIASDELTLADVSLAPALTILPMLGIDTSTFPLVSAWLNRIQERPAWQRATAM